MAKIKEEPIFVGIGENIIELTGADAPQTPFRGS